MMTPKEKAIELVNKFRIHSPVWEVKDDAKKCALIAVDEILNSWYPVNIHSGHEFHHDNLATSFYEYWEEVKQQINNL